MNLSIVDRARTTPTSGDEAVCRPTLTLAELVLNQINERGIGLGDLAERSGLTFPVVASMLGGDLEVDPRQYVRLLDACEIDRGTLTQGRTVLSIDLDTAEASARSVDANRWWELRQKPPIEEERPADQVLITYLSLLYHERGLDLGEPIPLAELDLGVLRCALALRTESVLGRLSSGHEQVDESKRAVAGPFAAVGAVVLVASIALVGQPTANNDQMRLAVPDFEPPADHAGFIEPAIMSGPRSTPVRAAANVERGSGVSSAGQFTTAMGEIVSDPSLTAVMVTASPAVTSAPVAPAPVDPAPAAPAPVVPVEGEVGTALVIER
ncbi:MAG: hypothetical protein GY708_01010 [Actinomycetia bacterium]|nr:hypothetical protein [Actinomycetes bacterium]